MIVLRCTAKLQKRLRIKAAASTAPSDGKLGDWSCNLLYVGQVQTILCVNHTTRLPVFLTAADGKQFPARLQRTLRVMLAQLGIPETTIAHECSLLDQFVFAKTNDRSVLGSLNDFGQLAAYYDLTPDPDQLIWLSLHLAKTPCTPLAYVSPDRAVQRLLSAE